MSETLNRTTLEDRINSLLDEQAWEHNPLRHRLSGYAGPYTLHIDLVPGVTFQVEHERFGILHPWAPANSRNEAMRVALAFVKAHARGQFDPKHLEQ